MIKLLSIRKRTHKCKIDVAVDSEGEALALGSVQDNVHGQVQRCCRAVLNAALVADCEFVVLSAVSLHFDSVVSVPGRSHLTDQSIIALSDAVELCVRRIEDFESAVACELVETDHNGLGVLGVGLEGDDGVSGVESVGEQISLLQNDGV